MSVSETLGWMLFGKPCRDFKEVNDRLNSALEKQREMELKQREQDGFAEAVMKGHALRMDRLEAANEALKSRVEALETKQEELKGRTLGWQEGFGATVREHLQRIEERIGKLLESDDSGSFEISQWVEELKAVRKSLSALERRVETIERGKLVFVHRDDAKPSERPYGPPPPIWVNTCPPASRAEPLSPPFKITCQADGRDAEGRP